MDLLKMNIFRGSFIKQAKFLVSTPKQSQECIVLAESDLISHEHIPMYAGIVSDDEAKWTWKMSHICKFKVHKYGEPYQEEAVLVLSERTYIPLDPNHIIKPKDRDNEASLYDISALHHDKALADVGTNNEQQSSIPRLIIHGCFIVIGLMVFCTFILKACEGAG